MRNYVLLIVIVLDLVMAICLIRWIIAARLSEKMQREEKAQLPWMRDGL